MNTVFGKKLSMTQRYNESGDLKTVTMVQVPEHRVTGLRTVEAHGYEAIQIGVGSVKKSPKALSTVYAGEVPRLRKELRNQADNREVGTSFGVSEVLQPGDLVRVSGLTKGKGFTGVVKRHGFAGGPKTHGQSDRHRAPGSIGAGTTMGRVLKGLRMAGRSGTEQLTVRNLTVMYVKADGTIYLSGPVPGHYGTELKIEKIGENKKFKPMVLLQEDKEKNNPEEAKVLEPEVQTSPEVVTEVESEQ